MNAELAKRQARSRVITGGLSGRAGPDDLLWKEWGWGGVRSPVPSPQHRPPGVAPAVGRGLVLSPKAGEGSGNWGRQEKGVCCFVFQAFSFLGSPAVFRAPLRPGLLGVFLGGGPDPARGLCRDALGPPDKGDQFWVLPAARLTPPPLKRFSQPGRCNCVFQLVNPRWLWHKAGGLHRAERGSRRIPQVPAAWRPSRPLSPKCPTCLLRPFEHSFAWGEPSLAARCQAVIKGAWPGVQRGPCSGP